MKKYIYAITEFNNDDYIRTLKGYTNEKTAIDECNELNGYTNDLEIDRINSNLNYYTILFPYILFLHL